MFVGRRCSSQLDIPTLWIKDEDGDGGRVKLTTRNISRSRRPSFEVSHAYHSRNKRRFRRYRHSLPVATNSTDPPRRTSMFMTPPTPSTVVALSPLTPSEATTILNAETIMLKPNSAGTSGVANEVSDELPILHPIHNYYQMEKGGSIVGNIFTAIRLRKGDRGDRYWFKPQNLLNFQAWKFWCSGE